MIGITGLNLYKMALNWLIENESVSINGGTCLQDFWGAKLPTNQTKKEPTTPPPRDG